jgi:hypothetical protein
VTIRLDPITGRPIRSTTLGPGDLWSPDVGGDDGNLLVQFGADLIASPFRGAEGLIRSGIDLASVPFGLDLRTSDDRFLGRSETILGGIFEAGFQFALPFRGGIAALSLANATAKNAGMIVRGLGLMSGGRGRFVRGTVAGAGADFLAFSGHEGRLADFIAQFPAVGELVPEFMKADEEDGEILGRIKGVLEGAGAGAAFEGVAMALRALRGAKKARLSENAATAAKELERIKREAEAAEKTAREALRRGSKDVEDRMRGGQPVGVNTPGKADPRRTTKRGPTEAKALSLRQRLDRGVEVSSYLVQKWELDKTDLAPYLRIYDKMAASGELKHLSVKPANVPRVLKGMIGMAQTGKIDLGRILLGDEPDPKLAIRSMEAWIEENIGPLKKRKLDTETRLEAIAQAKDMVGADHYAFLGQLETWVKGAGELENAPIVIHSLLGPFSKRAALASAAFRGNLKDVDLIKDAGMSDILGDRVQALQRVLQETNNLAVTAGALNHIGGSFGRGLRNMGQDAVDIEAFVRRRFPELDGTTDARKLLDDLGEDEVARRLEMIENLAALSNVGRMAAAARLEAAGGVGKALMLSTEWAISSMLYSARTIATNLIFPLTTAFYVPLENMVGGALTFNGSIIGRELRTMNHQALSLIESAKVFATTAWNNKARLDPAAQRASELGLDQTLFDPKVMEAAGLNGFGPGTWAGYAIAAMGKITSFPSRLMRGSDEGIKHMVAMGHGRALLHQQAIARGEDPSDYIPKTIDKLFDDGRLVTEDLIKSKVRERLQKEGFEGNAAGAAKRRTELTKEVRESLSWDEVNPVTAQLLERGREVTATSPIEGTGVFDQVTRTTQMVVNRLPAMRLVLPFVRTPANLVKFAGQRSLPGFVAPLMQLVNPRRTPASIREASQRNVRDFFSSNPDRRSEAAGRLAASLGVLYTVGTMSQQGLITGGGPDDPQRRDQLEAAGWQPYSIKMGDKYVQYLRADPFATMLGLVADGIESTKAAYAEGVEEPFEQISLGLLASLQRNITDKTYMTGLRLVMDAFADPMRHGGQLFAGLGGAFVPRTVTQFRDYLSDPIERDTYGLIGKLRARTPFFGQNPPLRNLMGEPVTRALGLGAEKDSPAALLHDMWVPITYREVSDDRITRELAKVQHGFDPPPRQKSGVRPDDYTNARGQDAYDRWSELHGQVEVQGRTIRQALRKLFDSREYREAAEFGTEFEEAPRVRLIRSVISRFRAKAWDATLKEYPDLSREYDRVLRERRSLRAGGTVENLLQVDPFRIPE